MEDYEDEDQTRAVEENVAFNFGSTLRSCPPPPSIHGFNLGDVGPMPYGWRSYGNHSARLFGGTPTRQCSSELRGVKLSQVAAQLGLLAAAEAWQYQDIVGFFWEKQERQVAETRGVWTRASCKIVLTHPIYYSCSRCGEYFPCIGHS